MQYLIVSILLLFCSHSVGQKFSGSSEYIKNNNNRNIDAAPYEGPDTSAITCPPGSQFAIGYCLRAKPLDPMGRVEMFCPEGTVEAYNPRTMYPECMHSTITSTYTETSVKDDIANTRSGPSLCQQQIDATERTCKGPQLSQLGSMAVMLARQVASARASGNMKQACAAAQQINSFSFSSNAAMAQMCASAIRKCKSACISESDGDGVVQCESFDGVVKAAATQSVQSAQNFATSSECVESVSGPCVGPSAYDNDNCPEFCQKPGRQNHMKCRIAASHCSDFNFAAQNIKLCACITNPLSPACGNANPRDLANAPPIVETTKPSQPSFEDTQFSKDYDTHFKEHEPTPSRVQGNNDYVDGSVPNSGKSFVYEEDAAVGAVRTAYDTNILYGTNRTPPPALGTPESIYGYSPAHYEPQPVKSEGFDLRDYLPETLVGRSKPKTRIPASAGYADQTITKADGLTNWQKVSRRIRILQPELIP